MANIFQRSKEAFNLLFRPGKIDKVRGYFQMMDGYVPSYSSYDGGVYEMELTRTCIHTFATHCSKLTPAVTGADLLHIQKLLDNKPNPFMTSSQFIYKVATIYDTRNTVIIAPLLDEFERLIGYYPVNPMMADIVKVEGSKEPYIRFEMYDGSKFAVELNRCGIVNKYLYKSDIFGETSDALNPTMQLLDLQNQGIANGIKNGANYRFMAQVDNFIKKEDLKKERESFSKEYLNSESGGLLLFPSNYKDIKQITSSAITVDPEQMKIIQTRVFDWFGTNEDILQNKSVGDSWAAYYEGKIEPFAVQLSQAMTCMTFTETERARNNGIVWSSNRLQYATNKEKLETSTQMFDRGLMSYNAIMDIWQLPHVEGGDTRYIRREYTQIDRLGEGEDNGNTDKQVQTEE